MQDNATNLQNMKKFRDDMEKEVTTLKATVESIREKVGFQADQIILGPYFSNQHTTPFVQITYLTLEHPKL